MTEKPRDVDRPRSLRSNPLLDHFTNRGPAMSEKLTRTQLKNLERLGGVNPADAVVLAPAVRHAGRRHRPGRRRRGWRPASWSATTGAWKGSSRRRRSGSRTTRSRWPPSRPNLVVVRSSPVRSESFASREEELQAREDQAFEMVKAALDAMGGDRGVGAVHHQGGRGRHQAERRLRQEPRPRRHDPARHGGRRGQALPRRRGAQGDRRRQPDQQPRELLLQDQGRRGRRSAPGPS